MRSLLHVAGETKEVDPCLWLSIIRANRYEAVIFDCDGTLVESSRVHFAAIQAAVQAQGKQLEPAWYNQRQGLDRLGLLSEFRKKINPELDIAAANTESISEFLKMSSRVAAIDETSSLVQVLFQAGLPMAVGSNAEQEVIAASLGAVGLRDLFRHIVSISDGLAAKPAPDIFIEAINRLKTTPERTLIFEDSTEGVQAGLNAGCVVVQIIHPEK